MVDELGSGVRNIYKYSKAYSGREPGLVEDDIFQIEIPIPKIIQDNKYKAQDKVQDKVQDKAQDKVQDGNLSGFNGTELKIIEVLKDNTMSRKEIIKALGYKSITGNIRKAIDRLLEKGLIEYTIPDKPRSKNQRYRINSGV
ncbi:MarR family transcriptional regulator [Clostridium gasigenes]|uniref:MarR family transcriptional regulator n=1 Tax=Clostridium gasigenes TaxID=94869 RepID=UPI001A9B370B|nr:hypothetical protein [Clostridium gasigenes]